MDFLLSFSKETIFFYNEIAIYLLFGFLVAGILHVIFPDSIVRKHLEKKSINSIIKSTIFGIPLPICSCGVVPVAASMRKSGASKGSTVSFLISTPQIGADSFMITYSLLGWVFAIFRIIASLITAILAGIFVNLLDKKDDKNLDKIKSIVKNETFIDRFKSLYTYIEYELLGSIANSLVIGILIAGLITTLIPDSFFTDYAGVDSNLLSMILMLFIGIPLYICATATTPIAASLILKGMSPGAALVLLLTGPATNAMSIATVSKIVGKKSTIVYLITIAVVSLTLGFLLNIFVAEYGLEKVIVIQQYEMLPEWLKISGSILLLIMIGWFYINTKILTKQPIMEIKSMTNKITLNVEGMTCMHCANSAKKAVEAVESASNAIIDLNNKQILFEISNNNDIEQVKNNIVAAGYIIK
jgi:uncharacterized membrane protein YraQ (UPF0718 family)/copper chaperone CopZ